MNDAIIYTKITPNIGAQILNLNISMLSGDKIIRQLLATWSENKVLLLRGQNINKFSLVYFSSLFGNPEKAFNQETKLTSTDDHPYVMIVSNIKENDKKIGHLGSKEAHWHTDMCYSDNPPIASLLYAREVPVIGGDTEFMDMYMVYNSLPEKLKERIANLSIKHDQCYTAVGELRYGYTPVSDLTVSPGSIHPIVKEHPITKLKCLYLGRRLNAYVVGLTIKESESLLDELWKYTVNTSLTWKHKWQVGDILIWDNRCTMHRRDSFDEKDRRLMWRTQVTSS